MRHLFDVEGMRALETLVRRHPLLAFDFDGTLAPIVPVPDEAEVPREVARLLERLAHGFPLGIVTGRRVEDVLPRLGFTPRYVIGNHGAEDPSGLLPSSDPALLDDVRERIAFRVEEFRRAGVRVEDKRHSMALHYRTAIDPGDAQSLIQDVLQDLDPSLEIFGGKDVVNVVTADAPDKGDAVASLVERCGANGVLFVGDDVNDETVFARAEPEWLTVRIGRDDPASRALFFLDDHTEMTVLLERILAMA